MIPSNLLCEKMLKELNNAVRRNPEHPMSIPHHHRLLCIRAAGRPLRQIPSIGVPCPYKTGPVVRHDLRDSVIHGGAHQLLTLQISPIVETVEGVVDLAAVECARGLAGRGVGPGVGVDVVLCPASGPGVGLEQGGDEALGSIEDVSFAVVLSGGVGGEVLDEAFSEVDGCEDGAVGGVVCAYAYARARGQSWEMLRSRLCCCLSGWGRRCQSCWRVRWHKWVGRM